ncbi:MAG: glycosyltransferase family 4 protein [Bacilli bacterium]|nr:glycosyltransferase family 4 protein [Bacilli bacterium]
MKKILLISNMYPSEKFKHYGVFVQNVENLLKENKFIVKKVVMTKQTNFVLKLIGYIIFHLKVIFRGLFGNYDYLYVHFVSHSSLGAVIVKKIKPGTKLILNCHGNDVVADTEKDFPNIKRSRKYLQYADKVVVPSNYFKKVLIDNYGILKDKIFVYPSGGVNTSLFINKDTAVAKKNSHLNSNYNYIGFISRIEKDKGWDTFIYMIKELEKMELITKYNLRFLMVGIGDEEYLMNDIIKELEVEKYIERRKMFSQDELVNIYNSLDLFIFPTSRKSDSLGLVGLEAMSTETFTIATNGYGPSDYMQDGINGLTFSKEDYKELSSKVEMYYEMDTKEKEKIKKEGRKTAILYDTLKTQYKILEVFE